MISVHQREKAGVEQARVGELFADAIKVFHQVADVVDADERVDVVEDGLVAGEVGAAEDVHHAVVGLALADGGDGGAGGVENGADRARAVGALHVGGDAHEVVAGAHEEGGGAAHERGDLIDDGVVARDRR